MAKLDDIKMLVSILLKEHFDCIETMVSDKLAPLSLLLDN